MSRQLESLLRQAGLATDAQLQRANERVRQQSANSLLEALVRDDGVPEEGVAELFVTQLKVPRVRVAAVLLDPEALKKVPERLARKHSCLPLSFEGRVLVMAMMNPIDYPAIQDIEFAATLSIRPVVATRTEILDGIEERYGAEDRIGSFLANVPDVQDIQILSEDSADLTDDVGSDPSGAPVVKMCNLVIHDAIRSAASDVHIEPALHDVQVRMRVDGVLRDYTRTPKWLHGPLVSRLKILAKLDIAERRLPQDGRVNVKYKGRSIDLRVSTLPTHFGEKVVLRVLGGLSAPNIERLGMAPEQQAMLEAAVAQPQGMILVTGPTGSGKSTTLYALLAKHHRPEINIVTVEDPIEYQLAGINQVQINPKAGLTFAGVLRSILRQDPDVILVGEMRDRETSEIAFQAAMTGHMVLSTLHTNSAVAAVSRLLDMNVDPAIIATSLSMVIAQRLVRRVCDDCREEYEPDSQVLARVGLGQDHVPVFRGAGCSSCGNTGYSGRVGIYEIFRPTNNIRKLINDKASEADIRNAARQAGMMLLREDALLKIRAGLTSPDEVLRVVQVDETEVPCPNCGAIIEADYSTCPYCAHSLKTSCESCGQSLKLDWKACPYCNSTKVVLAVVKDSPPDEPAKPETDLGMANKPLGEDDRDERWGWVRTVDPEAPAPGPTAPAAAATQAPAEPRGTRMLDAESFSDVPLGKKGKGKPARVPRGQTAPAAAVPVAAGAPVAAAPPAAPLVPARNQPDAVERRPLRILVVDDDPDIRMIVSTTLGKLPMSVQVEQAEDGQDAVEQALANPPDMVVLDVMMPRMDGFGACRALRENVRTAFVPILMLTASADQSNRLQGYLVGTDDYMSKPFQPVELNVRVARLLRRTYGV